MIQLLPKMTNELSNLPKRENGLKMGEKPKKARFFFDKWLHNYKMDML